MSMIGALPAPGATLRAELRSTESEQNFLVSLLTAWVSTFPNDHQTQHSGLGPLADAQNLLSTGGTFVSLSGGLCVNNFTIIVYRSQPRTIISLLILAKCRQRSLYAENQIPVHCCTGQTWQNFCSSC